MASTIITKASNLLIVNEIELKRRKKAAENIATEVDKDAGGYFRNLLIQAASEGIAWAYTQVKLKDK